MATRTVRSRSIKIKLSVRTLNDLEAILLEVQGGRMTKLIQQKASLLRGRLDRAVGAPMK
jgi:hypothetical protein